MSKYLTEKDLAQSLGLTVEGFRARRSSTTYYGDDDFEFDFPERKPYCDRGAKDAKRIRSEFRKLIA